jgi:hypothetical protein
MEIIYLFSKYSQQCKDFEKWLLLSSIDYKSICIDNKLVRKIVSNEIQRVPCLFVREEDGSLFKYQGKQAFDWIKKAMEEIQLQEEQQQSISSFQQERTSMDVPSTTPIPSSFFSSSHPVVPIVDLEHTSDPSSFQDKSGRTSMVENPSIETPSYEGMRRTIDSAPLIQQPSSKERLGESAPVYPEESSPSTDTALKPESLMSLAQKLQKEREESSSS